VSTEISEHLTGKPAPWRYSKALLEYYRAGDNSLYYDESIAKVRSYLIEMNAVAKTTGSRMVLCFVPGAVQVSKPSDINYFPWDQDLSDKALYDLERPLSSLKVLAQSIGIPLVDLTPYLKEAPDQPVYFPDSWHWNEKGHAVVARTLETALDSLGFLEK